MFLEVLGKIGLLWVNVLYGGGSLFLVWDGFWGLIFGLYVGGGLFCECKLLGVKL